MVMYSGKVRSRAAGMAAGILGAGGLLVAWQGRGHVKRFALSGFEGLFGWPSRFRLLVPAAVLATMVSSADGRPSAGGPAPRRQRAHRYRHHCHVPAGATQGRR